MAKRVTRREVFIYGILLALSLAVGGYLSASCVGAFSRLFARFGEAEAPATFTVSEAYHFTVLITGVIAPVVFYLLAAMSCERTWGRPGRMWFRSACMSVSGSFLIAGCLFRRSGYFCPASILAAIAFIDAVASALFGCAKQKRLESPIKE